MRWGIKRMEYFPSSNRAILNKEIDLYLTPLNQPIFMKKSLILIVSFIAFTSQVFAQEYTKVFDLSKYGIPSSINVLNGTTLNEVSVTLNMKEGEEDYMGTDVIVSYRKEDDYANIEKERGRRLVEAGKKNTVLDEETVIIIKSDSYYSIYAYHQLGEWFAIATVYAVDSEVRARKLAQALKPKK
jgi:hypothetical protein